MMIKRFIYLTTLFLVLIISGQEMQLQAQSIYRKSPWFRYVMLPYDFAAKNLVDAHFTSDSATDTAHFILDFHYNNNLALIKKDVDWRRKAWLQKAEKAKYASFHFYENYFNTIEHFSNICEFPNIKVFILGYYGKELPKLFPTCFADTSIEALVISSNGLKHIRNFKRSPLPKRLWAVQLELLWHHPKRVFSGFLNKLAKVDSLRSLVLRYQEDMSKWEVIPFFEEYCMDATFKDRYFFTLPKKLTKLRNLEELSIPNVDLLNEQNIEVLSQMTSLKRLAIHVCPKETFEYQELAQLCFLEELYLAYPINRMDFVEKLRPLFKKYLPNTKIIIEKDPSK